MKAGPNDCFHLTVDIVREIHGEAIARFGGLDGIREMPLLESAVAAPQATFGGESIYRDVIEIAAAYLFYPCATAHPGRFGTLRSRFRIPPSGPLSIRTATASHSSE